MMTPAEEEQIGNVGFTAFYPVHVVVNFGEPVGEVTAGKSAAFVAFADSFGCWCRDCSGESAHVKGFGYATGDYSTDFGIATDS